MGAIAPRYVPIQLVNFVVVAMQTQKCQQRLLQAKGPIQETYNYIHWRTPQALIDLCTSSSSADPERVKSLARRHRIRLGQLHLLGILVEPSLGGVSQPLPVYNLVFTLCLQVSHKVELSCSVELVELSIIVLGNLVGIYVVLDVQVWRLALLGVGVRGVVVDHARSG